MSIVYGVATFLNALIGCLTYTFPKELLICSCEYYDRGRAGGGRSGRVGTRR